MLLSMSSGHSPGDFCSGFCSCGDLFSETDNELSMQHAYPVHQEISDEILPMHYGRTFTRERKKRVKPAQLSSIRDLTQLNVCVIYCVFLVFIHFIYILASAVVGYLVVGYLECWKSQFPHRSGRTHTFIKQVHHLPLF